MADMSHLDKKYFIDENVFNCPYCNRNNVTYKLVNSYNAFDWSNDKKCHVYFVRCKSCQKMSMHLSFEDIGNGNLKAYSNYTFQSNIDIDSKLFYSVPTSFFALDDRIPRILRELISEADGCMKMNYLTGASACMRKSIYELLIIEKISGDKYDEKIKNLKKKYSDSDPALFDILGHIQQMTSDKIHEQSWDKWDSNNLTLIIETLKTVLYDIYVVPQIKKERSNFIQQLREKVLGKSDNNSSA